MAPTQDALYAEIDLALSWSERELPQRERTKHVHALHPYLGKFIPQLVEALVERYVPPGGAVLDPFAGSGTTLVQALENGRDASGADIAAFNVLLMRVKTADYNLFRLEHEVRETLAAFEAALPAPSAAARSRYLERWYAPRALNELLAFRELIGSARLTPHFDLDFPRAPQNGPYWCHKHRRECRPVEEAARFLRRYALDTVSRIKAFGRVRARGRAADVLHGDARTLDFGRRFDAVITSPPYPGLIDYHEQHRYAYELLGLPDLGELELGRGTSRRALTAYVDGIAAVLANAASQLRPAAPVLVVVNDRRAVYPDVLAQAGLRLEERLRRHVNRRTGRRAGEYFEDILVARAVD
jgi:hypothetical protein